MKNSSVSGATRGNSSLATVFRAVENPFFPNTDGAHFQARDLGVADVTDGAYSVKLFRAAKAGAVHSALHWHEAAFQFLYVIRGAVEFQFGTGEKEKLWAGDGIYQPTGCEHRVVWISDDLELIEIVSPAMIRTVESLQ